MNSETKQPNQVRYDDEISLYDIYRVLVERKYIILFTIIACLGLAVLYLVITPPTYETKIRLFPAKPEMLLMSRPEYALTRFSPDAVFKDIRNEIQKIENWRKFETAAAELFPDDKKSGADELLKEHPIKLSELTNRKDKDAVLNLEHLDVIYQHNEAELTAKILDGYLQFIRKQYINELVKDIEERIAIRIENLENEIELMRKHARLGREDAIEKLSKDLEQAKTLGIVDNLLMRMTEARTTGQNVNIISDSQFIRNYMRGTRALKTELDVLLKRESDDPYISGLRDKQLDLEVLRNLRLNSDKFTPYLQDGKIINPQSPIKPRKSQILVMSVIAGAFLGVFLALMNNVIQNAREQSSNNQI